MKRNALPTSGGGRTLRAGRVAMVGSAALLGLAGCAIEPSVPRVYDGRVIEGDFIPSEAYSAYLRGVLAEEAGDYRTALAAYEETVREDDEDPEPFTRIGDMRCRLDPHAHTADDAFNHAHAIDPHYAPLSLARARCAAARGQGDAAIAYVDQVGRADRESASIEALYVTLAKPAPVARARAIALTAASGEHVVAWEALIAWGRTHDDPELLARGLEGLLKVAPMRSLEVEAGALELLGAGQTGLAQRVAAAITDAPADLGVRSVHDTTVARLAIDEAIARGDMATAQRRAVRGHVSRAEVAGRAMLAEHPKEAEALAAQILAADPTDAGAFMVLGHAPALAQTGGSLRIPPVNGGASGSAPVNGGSLRIPPVNGGASGSVAANGGNLRIPPVNGGASVSNPELAPSHERAAAPAACVLALARRIDDVAAARVFIARVATERMAPHDPVVGAAAVDLAVRGAIADAALPPELRLEVAARRKDAPPQVDPATLDAKHALLFHSLVDATGAPARSLLAKLAPAADRDALVAFAFVRAAVVSPPAGDALVRVRAAIAAQPTDPLVLAAAVELAQKAGKAEDVAPARARLMAVARTQAERALAQRP